MNKKIIAIIAVIIIAVAAVCLITSGGKNEQETTAPSATSSAATDSQPITVNIESEPQEPLTSGSYDKKITVTLPIDVVDEEYGDDLDAFAEANGYFSIKKVGKDEVKIKMREYSYRLLLTSVGIETIGGIGYTIDSGDYSFVNKIAKYNSDFSDVIFTVDKEKYESAENKDEFFNSVAFCCLHYQKYNKDSEGVCIITLCEKGTNILVETRKITESELQ